MIVLSKFDEIKGQFRQTSQNTYEIDFGLDPQLAHKLLAFLNKKTLPIFHFPIFHSFTSSIEKPLSLSLSPPLKNLKEKKKKKKLSNKMASQNPIPPSLFLFIILLTTTPLSAARRLSSSPQQPENDSPHPPTTPTFSLAQQPAAVNYAVSLRKVPAGPNPLHN